LSLKSNISLEHIISRSLVETSIVEWRLHENFYSSRQKNSLPS
jgi:hypothetical protein